MTSDQQNQLDHLAAIRTMMERSSRFISLSGLAGVFAGSFALLGAAVAYWKLDSLGIDPLNYLSGNAGAIFSKENIIFLGLDAILVLVLSLLAGIYFTTRKARKSGHEIWNRMVFRMLANLAIPLITGALFCLVLYHYQEYRLIAPCTLIFYGLALINAGKYTLIEIKYLGLSEIILGLVACFLPGMGLLFWSIGFGILHIFYGTMMHFRYDRQ